MYVDNAVDRFTSNGEGRTIEWQGNRVTVWTGKTASGIPAVAVEMYHAPSLKETKFLLTENGAASLQMLLTEALDKGKTPVNAPCNPEI